jgi:peptide/nickel transport system substrate-binding protein
VLRTRGRSKALAALSVATLAIVAAACGGDDDNATNTTSAGSVASGTTTPSAGSSETTTAASGTSSAATTGSSTPSGGSESGTTPATISPGVRTPKDPANPVQGGTLVYGLEADSANPWAPYRVSCATSCLAVLRGISDSLFADDQNGQAVPNLVQTVDHNADYTQWTMHIREGIKFQDGTPLDGAAVKFNIDTCIGSPLTSTALLAIDHVTASGQDVTVFTRGGPWVAFPTYFTHGQCAYMFSPKWLGSLSDVPQRNQQSPVYDSTLAATPADGDPQKPVGLGAFEYESYSPGNGNAFKAVRNPDYWRGPNGITGEKLPYLDEIDYVVAVDEDTRANSVRSGDFQIMMTSMGDTINEFLGDKKFEVNSSTLFGDTGYLMINMASGATDPDGKNAQNPLLNLDCRKALAGSIDLDRVDKERSAGLEPPANGPFPPGSVGYLKDTGYPKFDVATAQGEMDKCLAALKTDHIEFSFNTTNDPFNVETNTLIISMWTDAFGNKVQAKITPIEQGQYIGLALVGTFQMFGWRNHNGSDPDQQRVWWQSVAATPIGQLAPNFSRIVDPKIDAALNTIKSNPDPAARKAAAEDINKEFGAQVYNLWLGWSLWGIISQPYVHGVQANKLPDGKQGIGLAYAGLHNINQMWCDGGKCQ